MLSNNILSTRNAPYTDFQRWAEPHLPFCIFYCLPLITHTRCGISFPLPSVWATSLTALNHLAYKKLCQFWAKPSAAQ